MSFAQKTKVPVEKTRAEIERLVRQHKADQFASGWDDRSARIQFKAHERIVRFTLQLPDRTQAPWKYNATKYDQEMRRCWRALLLVIKAKLEGVESKITTFEEEFMAHIVMPDGKTMAEHALPAIAAAYQSGKMPTALLQGW